MAYVYRHRRLDKNEIFYIGIGSDNKGKYSRAYSKDNRNKHWDNLIKLTEYQVEIISEDWLTWEEACEKEKFWIRFYGRVDLKTGSLVNMTDGGDGNLNPSYETREKISSRYYPVGKENPKYRIPLSEDHKKKVSQNHHDVSGKNNPMYGSIGGFFGKKHKDSSKIKCSLAKIKKIQHLETGLIFNSQNEAALYFKISPSLITLYKKQGKFILLKT